ncbi:MAG: septal ring lytic transglycosylase RlpA family protein, partial [Desulfovibrionaceae bacterium]|nr:septal ring lytic transglycosylase RlpA family protein [Desulfovibrionaceae bacterium]
MSRSMLVVCAVCFLTLSASGCALTSYSPFPQRVSSYFPKQQDSVRTDSTPRYDPKTEPYTVLGRTYYPLPSAAGYSRTGIASWYGEDFHGKPTASGETYDMHALTAAHKTLPLGTRVRVTNLSNGRWVDLTVNDRGPFVGDRLIDLSYAAARRIDSAASGLARVRVEALGSGDAPGPVYASSAGSGRLYYVQVGAYADLDNAIQARERLLRAGFDNTRIRKVVRGGQAYHLVQ